MTYDLGLDVDTLTVRLHRDADFNSTLAVTGGFLADANVRLKFTAATPVADWAATITNEEAVWAVDHTLTNVRVHGEPVELWVGDECWASGRVVRLGA